MASEAPYNFWTLDSELYAHVEASTRLEVTGAGNPREMVQPPATPYECSWGQSDSGCNFTAETVAEVIKHISAAHIRNYRQPDLHVRCMCVACPLSKEIRRDTIIRHIREMHYDDKYRRKIIRPCP